MRRVQLRSSVTWTVLIGLLAMTAYILMTIILKDETVFAANTSYYVDAIGGNDSNSGTSTTSAWKTLAKVNATTFGAGDKILLKAGTSYTGQLWPKGSGVSGNPIIVDKYGAGSKPIINGAGTVTETVRLYNQQYWEISNLEITNIGATRALRRAVWIEAADIGTANHIYLTNLDIRDVNSLLGDWELDGGGIIIRVSGGAVPTIFNDVRIEGNTLTKVDSTGIFVRSTWMNRGAIMVGAGPWAGSTNIVVRNNTLNDIGGDGIVICESTAPLVEYNVVANADKRTSGSHIAIWNINTDDALFQYNEAYLTRNPNGKDGLGFDADGNSHRTVFQYNYSHDNEGGFMDICNFEGTQAFNDDVVIRYNISQNDRYRIFANCGRNVNANIYNNTIFTAAGGNTLFLWDYADPTTSDSMLNFRNNIIYNTGVLSFDCAECTRGYTPRSFDYNTFFGNHHSSEPADPHKSTADPKFVNPGSGGNGRNTVDGYKLRSDSPSINTGVTIANNGGKDYWGNTVPYAGGATDRGAFEYQGTPPSTPITPPIGTTWKASLQFGSVQGQDQWYYKQKNLFLGTYSNDTWNAVNQWWAGSQFYAIITKNLIAPDAANDSIRAWVAPASGTITISGRVRKSNVTCGDGAIATIMKNSTLLWGPQTVAYNDALGYSHYLTTTVTAGDTIYFGINKNTLNDYCDTLNWDPTITWGDRKVWKASEGFSETQGQDQWHYREWNGSSYTYKTWDAAKGFWVGNVNYSTIMNTSQHAQTGRDAVRTWVAPKAGTVTITGTAKKDNVNTGDGVVVSILQNLTTIWGNQTIAWDDSTGYTHSVVITVAAGDNIDFRVQSNAVNDYGDNVNWDPIITYN